MLKKVIDPRRINGKCNMAHNDFVEKPKGKVGSESLGIDGKIILHRILKNQVGKMCHEFIWIWTQTSVRSL
jgi:hypothetical protein